MRILGISAFYHDSAAALLEDGRIVAAAQEERFSRKKHDAGFPHGSVSYCLEAAGCGLDGIDYVVFYDKPFLKFERLLETYVAFAPRGFKSFRMAMPVWLREKLFQKDLLKKELSAYGDGFDWKSRILFAEHHQSHAASAFYPSPFEEAAIVLDDVGIEGLRGRAYSLVASPPQLLLGIEGEGRAEDEHLLLHTDFGIVRKDIPATWQVLPDGWPLMPLSFSIKASKPDA